MSNIHRQRGALVEKKYLIPFILLTTLFALWGFANDITNPLVAAFKDLMEISTAKASLVQFAFYCGYATMAIPAALFIRRYSYKSGILLGLGLYAFGAFLFIPAANYESFAFFCVSLYILTFGLAFLETTANPYILSLGSKETSTRRLNMAQAFNPVGSLTGMAVASFFVLPNLMSDQRDGEGNLIFSTLTDSAKASIRVHDLAVIRDPYVIIGLVVVVMLVIIACTKMPKAQTKDNHIDFKSTFSNLRHNRVYVCGVFTQVFYVAAQIMVWTFIIQYAGNLGINKATAQLYNILAMGLALTFRFVGTYIMKYIRPPKMLVIFGLGATVCTLATILINGIIGLYFLIAISAFMSIMFPSIYGIALEKVEPKDTYLGSAFLVMAIVGGALMPPLQGAIIDLGTIGFLPAVNVSFVLPLICFIIVTVFGTYAGRAINYDK